MCLVIIVIVKNSNGNINTLKKCIYAFWKEQLMNFHF
jgi:hypothetical protein